MSAFDPKRTLNVRFCCDAQRGGRRRQIATAAIRSIGAAFSFTRAVKGHMNSPWTVRTTPAVSVHVRVAFRRGRGICGCIELICYQITKAPAAAAGASCFRASVRCDTTKEDNMLEPHIAPTACVTEDAFAALMEISKRPPVVFVEGRGSWLTDQE